METSYLLMGFLCAREYFKGDAPREKYLRKERTRCGEAANWNWHTTTEDKLFWHWSPTTVVDMNFPVWGWNECLITYIMAAASPRHGISKEVYNGSWAGSKGLRNGNTYYGIKLPLRNFDRGGPLFFEQYAFQGIDPNG